MIYAITIVTRDLTSYVDISSKYYEFYTIKDLNDCIFSNVCNTDSNREIISLYFEVFDNIQNPCPVGGNTDKL